MTDTKHTPIEDWVEKSVTEWYKKEMFNSNHIADVVSYIHGVKAVLKHLGLQDIPNPAEYISDLQSENERLKAEIQQLKGDCLIVKNDSTLGEFIQEVIRINSLYHNKKFTLAESTKNKLFDSLDDIMRTHLTEIKN